MPALTRSHFYTFIPLFFVLIIDAMGAGLVFPILGPIYLQATDGLLPVATSEVVRNILYGITLSGFALSMFIGAPLLGDLSDQLGRKKILLLCLFGTGIGLLISVLGIMVKSVCLIIAGRFITGFCAGSQPIAQAAINDISTDENKAFNLGLITSASCLGFVFGPILSGFFSNPAISAHFSFSTPFLVAGLLALANAALLIKSFTETYQVVTPQKIDILKGLKIFLSAFARKDIRLLVLIYFLWQCAWTLYFQYMSLYLVHTYQYTSAQIGWFMSCLGVIFVLNMLVVIPLALHIFKLETAIFVGLCIFFVSTAASIFLRQEWAPWALALPINIGSGLAYTTMLTLFSNAVDKKSQGWIMGVSTAVASMAWFITGLGSGIFASLDLRLPFIVGSVLIFISVLLMYRHNRQ